MELNSTWSLQLTWSQQKGLGGDEEEEEGAMEGGVDMGVEEEGEGEGEGGEGMGVEVEGEEKAEEEGEEEKAEEEEEEEEYSQISKCLTEIGRALTQSKYTQVVFLFTNTCHFKESVLYLECVLWRFQLHGIR